MGTLTNCEDTECGISSGSALFAEAIKEIEYYLQIITCDLSIYTIVPSKCFCIKPY